MAAETIWLERPAEDIPWGFRLQGGIDYHYPLSVQRVTGGSIASTGLQAGDVILRIGDTDTTQLTHSEAMIVIKNAGNQLQLSIVRPGQDISAGASNNFQPSSAMGYQPTPPAPPVPQVDNRYYHTSSSIDGNRNTFRGQPNTIANDLHAVINEFNHTLSDYMNNYPADVNAGNRSAGNQNEAGILDLDELLPANRNRNVSGTRLEPTASEWNSPNSCSVIFEPRSTALIGISDGSVLCNPDVVTSSEFERDDMEMIGFTDYGRVYPDSGMAAAPTNGNGSLQGRLPQRSDNSAWSIGDRFLPMEEPLEFCHSRTDEELERRNVPSTRTDPNRIDQSYRNPLSVPPPPPPPGPPPALSSPAAIVNKPGSRDHLTSSAAKLSPSTGSGAYRSLSNDYYANSMSPGVAANAYDSPSAAALSPSTSDYPFGSPSTMGGGGGGFLNGGVGTEQPDYYSGVAATGYDDTSGYYGSPSGKAMSPDTTGYGSLSPSSQPTKTPPVVPDAILNMAAKGPQDKKPFAYVGDVNDIREQRERMRRRTTPGGSSSLPRYQHMLNMPQFEDPAPVARTIRSVHGTPPPAERQSSGGGGGSGGDQNDAAIVSNLQFNTPIGLYSGDNVVEALQGQTGGQVSGVVGLPKKDKNDFTQSAVYKMIHGLDQPKQRPPVGFIDASQHQSTPPRQPSVDDETRFSGLQSRNDIPSKSFQRLQSWTGNNGPGGPVGQNVGGSEIDTTSIRRNVAGALGSDSEQDPGQYNEKSIRYTGRNIPGRSFKMLQQMTGGPQSTDSYASPARELASDDDVRSSGGLRSRSETPSRTYQPQQQQQQPANVGGSEIDYSSIRHNLLQASDGGSGGGGGEGQGDVGQYDQTSIRYQGKSIPSRSFRMLQQMTGGDPGTPPVQQPTSVRAPRQPAQHHQQQQQPRRYRTPSGGEQPHQPQPTAASDDGSAQQQQQPKRDIRYTGGSIPSQSFRMLQQSIGVDSEAAAGGANAQQQQVATAGAVNGGDTLQSAGGRQVKVVRLRSQASTEDTGATEF